MGNLKYKFNRPDQYLSQGYYAYQPTFGVNILYGYHNGVWSKYINLNHSMFDGDNYDLNSGVTISANDVPANIRKKILESQKNKPITKSEYEPAKVVTRPIGPLNPASGSKFVKDMFEGTPQKTNPTLTQTSSGNGTMIPKEELQEKLKLGWTFGKDAQGRTTFNPPAKKRWQAARDYESILKFLNSQGYNLKEDGLYGPQTRKAIIDWQSKNGLKADGYWGKNTEAKYQEFLNSQKEDPEAADELTVEEIDSELPGGGEDTEDVDEADAETDNIKENETTITDDDSLYTDDLTEDMVRSDTGEPVISDEDIMNMSPRERWMQRRTFRRLKRENNRDRLRKLNEAKQDYFADQKIMNDMYEKYTGSIPLKGSKYYDAYQADIHMPFSAYNKRYDEIMKEYSDLKDYYLNQIKRFYKKGGRIKSAKCRCGCKPTLIKDKGGRIREKYNCK